MRLSDDAQVISNDQHQIARELDHLVAKLPAKVKRLAAGWAFRRQKAREISELSAFSDRDLWDIGLGRSDVMSIMNGTFSRD